MDEMDYCQQEEEAFRASAVLRAQALAENYLSRRHGDGHCLECGDTIPASRLKAIPGARRCLPCQQDWESRNG
ncbi:MAG: TraR/DksA C4-type zinc finger protein [Magnetococcales bacterium]|nr:TraR/DksA C4-type zinc finger protein [Magnetococcales bacterium]